MFVTPSRWMAGGKGLDKYRERMLSDKRMRSIVDYPKLYEGFPGVKIRGGISYFLWDREHKGPCAVQTIWDGQPTGSAVERYLDAYDILVRRNEAVPILEKVKAKGESTLLGRVSSQKPFGLRTFFHGKPSSNRLKNPVKLFGSQKVSWVERSKIPTNVAWVDKWKVLMTRVQGTSAAIETKFLSKPIVAEPGTACTESYLVAGLFDTEVEANNYASYLRTRFARFLRAGKPLPLAYFGEHGLHVLERAAHPLQFGVCELFSSECRTHLVVAEDGAVVTLGRFIQFNLVILDGGGFELLGNALLHIPRRLPNFEKTLRRILSGLAEGHEHEAELFDEVAADEVEDE